MQYLLFAFTSTVTLLSWSTLVTCEPMVLINSCSIESNSNDYTAGWSMSKQDDRTFNVEMPMKQETSDLQVQLRCESNGDTVMDKVSSLCEIVGGFAQKVLSQGNSDCPSSCPVSEGQCSVNSFSFSEEDASDYPEGPFKMFATVMDGDTWCERISVEGEIKH